MNCKQARQRILAGTPADEAFEDHLSQCPACAALAADEGALAQWLDQAATASSAVPEDFLGVLAQDLQGERRLLARPCSWSTPVRFGLATGALTVVALLGLHSLRPDLAQYPLIRLVLELTSFISLSVGAAILWLRPLHRPALPHWLNVTLLVLAVLLPWGFSALPAAHLGSAASRDDFVRQALACFSYGSVLGLSGALFMALLGRGARRRIRLAMLPAAAGALAGLISLHLHCPITEPLHLLAGHAPIVLTLVLLAGAYYRLARR